MTKTEDVEQAVSPARGILYRRLQREAVDAGLSDVPAPQIVTPDELAQLPPVVRRYLGFMGVVGRPQDMSFRARFEGRFRLRGKAWMPVTAWQYNSGLDPARVYVMRLRLAGVVPITGVDIYANGRGTMIGKLGGLVPVAHGEGDEFDLGELVTWLNDAVLLAPSMLLRPAITWTAVDASRFDITLEDAGRSVTARVLVDERGAPTDFSTEDRYADLPGGLVQARWTTPVQDWTFANGRPLPTLAWAIWHLPDGPMPYVEGSWIPASIARNVAP